LKNYHLVNKENKIIENQLKSDELNGKNTVDIKKKVMPKEDLNRNEENKAENDFKDIKKWKGFFIFELSFVAAMV